MEGCRVVLICLVVLSCVTFGISTKEDNICYPKIPCDDGSCISREDWCDRSSECLDDTDENYCETKGFFRDVDNKCNTSIHFECANRKCVPIVLLCDGFDDCKDNSDEANCPSPVETKTTERPTSAAWTTSKPPVSPEDVTRRPMPYRSPDIPVTGPLPGIHPFVPKKRMPLSWPLPAFHFQQDRAQSFGRRYGHAVDRAEQWLLESSNKWDQDTPRALVALSIAGNSFHSRATVYDITRRKLKLDLGAKLLRNTENRMNDHLLATYINALMATCQDPRKVYNRDLVSLLHDWTHDPRRRTAPTPFVLLTLCIANSSVPTEDFSFLESIVHSPINGDVSKDRFILSTSVLACIHKRGLYENELRGVLSTASQKLLEQQLDDGSFGSIYSTALAAQAFFALDSNAWNPDETLDFLMSQQRDDGSFGDLLATSYILPVLSGKSLVHMRNTQCEKSEEGSSSEHGGWEFVKPKKTVLYSLAMGPEQRNRITFQINAPTGANFFEIMKEAQKLHPRYRFLYTEFLGKIDVYTISGVPNDPERDTYWQLYVLSKRDNKVPTIQAYHGDIRHLIPEDQQEVLFWYLPYEPRF